MDTTTTVCLPLRQSSSTQNMEEQQQHVDEDDDEEQMVMEKDLPYRISQWKGRSCIIPWTCQSSSTSPKWKAIVEELRKAGFSYNRSTKLKKPDHCAYLYAAEDSTLTDRKGKKAAKGNKKMAWTSVQLEHTGKVNINARSEEGARQAYGILLEKLRSCPSFAHVSLDTLKSTQMHMEGKFNARWRTEDMLAQAKSMGVTCVMGKSKHAPELKVTLYSVNVRFWSSGSFSIQGVKDNDRAYKIYLKLKELVASMA